MDNYEKELIDRCIESHLNMIKFHRRAIVELSRKAIQEPEICEECLGLKFSESNLPVKKK